MTVSSEFLDKLKKNENRATTMAQFAKELVRYYETLDKDARTSFRNTAIEMFANYENKWTGEVINGAWKDLSDKSGASTYLSIPLLASRTDTQTVFYTKTRPQYKAQPFIQNSRTKKLIKMCEEIGNAELNRLLTNFVLQRESQYLALATVSYRQLSLEVQPSSPVINQQVDREQKSSYVSATCDACGETSQHKLEEVEGVESAACGKCLHGNLQFSEPQEQSEMIKVNVPVKIPRPVLGIPNPTQMQFDFDAPSFKDSKFSLKRKKILKRQAEFIYQIDLTSADTSRSSETMTDSRMVRQPLKDSPANASISFSEPTSQVDDWVDDIDIWLDPCEYGLTFIKEYGCFLVEKYPDGLYLKIIGGQVVAEMPCKKNKEIIRLQQGTRPNSNTGTGLVNLAGMNDTINNCLSLDYAVMRTHGFPFRLIRGKYIKKLAPALQTIILNTLPETSALKDQIHTEQPSNTSGMAGVLSRQLGEYMQEVSGTYSFGGQVSPAMRASMGSATGAASVQEGMADRMGLVVQMRIDADIDTIWAVLALLRKDERNKQVFTEHYDTATVEAFFNEDLESLFYFEPVKGSEEPQLESVNTFKITTFMQSTAALTGLAQYNAPLYYDLVAKLGDTLNISLDIGEGRKEKNLAESRIIRIKELYKEKAADPLVAQVQPEPQQMASLLVQSVQQAEQEMLDTVIAINVETAVAPLVQQVQQLALSGAAGAQELQNQIAVIAQQKQTEISERIEAYLYNYEALADSYSDWLQSDEGQSAPVPVQTAVTILFSYAIEMKSLRAKVDAREKQELMAMLMPPDGMPDGAGEEKPKVKRDGSTGAGRPRDVHPSNGEA